MNALALLVLACAQDAPAVQRLAPASRPVEIGTSVEWTLEVRPPAGLDVVALPLDPELDVAWAVVDGPEVRHAARAGDPARTVRWTLLPLAGGSLSTPDLVVELDDGLELAAPGATVEVASALAEGEDEPRPLAGFRDVEDRAVTSPGTALLAALGGALLVVGFVLARRFARRRPGPDAAAAADPRAALDALDPKAPPAELLAAVGPLARAAADRACGADRAALTDEEWGDALRDDPLVPGDVATALARVADESAAVRFGGWDPTPLAAREALDAARANLDALERAGGGGEAAA